MSSSSLCEGVRPGGGLVVEGSKRAARARPGTLPKPCRSADRRPNQIRARGWIGDREARPGRGGLLVFFLIVGGRQVPADGQAQLI